MALVRGPLPLHRPDGTLPPTSAVDGRLWDPNLISPYMLTVPELIAGFGTDEARLDLLAGFLGLRQMLREHGFDGGFHWIGGSFVRAGGRPRDLDVACFVAGSAVWDESLRDSRPDSFGKQRIKERHGCDARFVDLRTPAIIRWVNYWSHVYSSEKPIDGGDPALHYARRIGFLEVPIATRDGDAAARSALAEQRRVVGSGTRIYAIRD